jgi:hypothetical protein
MGRHKKSRSLASRKRHKDVSGAMFENTSYHAQASAISGEAPKAGFETAVPRRVREMQRAMEQMADREAGKPSTWRPAHREDLPRPQQQKKQHASTKTQSSARDFAAGDEARRPKEGAVSELAGRDRTRGHDHVDTNLQRGKKRPKPEGSDEQPDLAREDRNQKQRRPHEATAARVPKFGETNAAPPELLIGGNLKKMAARSAQQTAMLARQREQAIANYKKAKAARARDVRDSGTRE